jgi:DNA-binding transcriptional ArsR family regulator
VKRPDTSIEAPTALFAALGDPMRLRLVVRLSRGEPLSITELASGTKLTRQAVTKHLHVLADAGVATASRFGRQQLWSLDEHRLTQARVFLDRLTQQWDNALARLKQAVEEEE